MARDLGHSAHSFDEVVQCCNAVEVVLLQWYADELLSCQDHLNMRHAIPWTSIRTGHDLGFTRLNGEQGGEDIPEIIATDHGNRPIDR